MLHIDTTGALAKTITPTYGVTNSELVSLQTSMRKYIEEWLSERKAGHHEWGMDPYDKDMIEKVKASAERIKKLKVKTILWIGIGGSGLGPKVIQEVFEDATTVEFITVDFVDPRELSRLLSSIDFKRTAVVVVSKSGGTLEPMSAFFLFWEKLKKELKGKANQHAIAITDPQKGTLRSFAMEQEIEILPIPPGVGGRYCIFTPVGFLAIALLNGDLDAFARGAKEMDTRCQQTHPEENPAALLAMMQYLLDEKKGYLMRIIMPYVQDLMSFGRWNQQLIAESLGKNERTNPFPVAAIGSQDQHSLLQQWMEGPRKGWHLFIKTEKTHDLRVPKSIDKDYAFIADTSFADIVDALHEGTSRGLSEANRPHITITLTTLDEYHLGQLFFLMLTEVVLLGKLYRIDPYGQPGVEIGKRITKELLSKKS